MKIRLERLFFRGYSDDLSPVIVGGKWCLTVSTGRKRFILWPFTFIPWPFLDRRMKKLSCSECGITPCPPA
jgi:hypothetical protein